MGGITFKASMLIAGLTLFWGKTCAQGFDTQTNGSGIYVTESDFLKNNITLFSENNADNHLECSLEDVMLTRAGKRFKLGTGSFFGYYQDGARYRYYHDNSKSYGYYKILEDSGVVAYSRTVSSPKTGLHVWYYYSDTLNSPVKRISTRSLKNVPPEIYPTLAKYLVIKSGKNFVPNS